MPSLQFKLPSEVLLNFVAIIWGTEHSIIKLIVGDDANNGSADLGAATSRGGDVTRVAAFTLARFFIAALVASPFMPSLRILLVGRRRRGRMRSDIGGCGSVDELDSPTGGRKRIIEHNVSIDDNMVHRVSFGIQTKSEGQVALEPKYEQGGIPHGEDQVQQSLIAWRWGAEMGTWMFLGYACQAVGLQYTTASKSGFLLYLNVKFVPFLARMILGRRISLPTWVSAAMALTGTALLSSCSPSASSQGADADSSSSSSPLNVGDIWSIAAAVSSAMYILRLESASRQVQQSSELSSASLIIVTMWSAAWLLASSFCRSFSVDAATADIDEGPTGMGVLPPRLAIRSATWLVWNIIASHPIALIYLGGVTSALANYIQARGQRGMTAERASVIYAMDPVYGAGFSRLLLGETLGGVGGVVGAGLIAFAAATNAFLDLGGDSDSGGSGSGSGSGTSGRGRRRQSQHESSLSTKQHFV